MSEVIQNGYKIVEDNEYKILDKMYQQMREDIEYLVKTLMAEYSVCEEDMKDNTIAKTYQEDIKPVTEIAERYNIEV